jgi:signal transduction histidine kinase
MAPPSNLPRLSARVALLLGFGGLLVIVALAGVESMLVVRQIRRDDDSLRRQFLFRNHLLNDIRSELYLSGTYVRDYLLEPETGRAETYKANLEEVHKEMESGLASYAAQVEPEETQHYQALRIELSHYWEVLQPILKWSPEERRRIGYVFLRDEVFPRRAAMLEVAGRIADINEQQLNAGNERVVGLLSAFQTRLTLTVLATLALGLGLAAFSTRRILRLEAQAQARYQEVSEARKQLTDLSARLLQAQETERRSLARELHDEVGQSLTAVLLELRNLSTALSKRSEEQSRTHVDTIRTLVEGTVGVVRNMSLLLRPSMLDDLGLVPALRWQAREVSKRTSMDVNMSTEGVSDDLPDEYKTCIYRVVQEALNNSARHSHGTTVRIRVHQDSAGLTLSVQDDGRGFDVQQSRGMGLLGIEERVARLGGQCRIHSEPGSGTILRISLPFLQSRDREGAS